MGTVKTALSRADSATEDGPSGKGNSPVKSNFSWRQGEAPSEPPPNPARREASPSRGCPASSGAATVTGPMMTQDDTPTPRMRPRSVTKTHFLPRATIRGLRSPRPFFRVSLPGIRSVSTHSRFLHCNVRARRLFHEESTEGWSDPTPGAGRRRLLLPGCGGASSKLEFHSDTPGNFRVLVAGKAEPSKRTVASPAGQLDMTAMESVDGDRIRRIVTYTDCRRRSSGRTTPTPCSTAASGRSAAAGNGRSRARSRSPSTATRAARSASRSTRPPRPRRERAGRGSSSWATGCTRRSWSARPRRSPRKSSTISSSRSSCSRRSPRPRVRRPSAPARDSAPARREPGGPAAGLDASPGREPDPTDSGPAPTVVAQEDPTDDPAAGPGPAARAGSQPASGDRPGCDAARNRPGPAEDRVVQDGDAGRIHETGRGRDRGERAGASVPTERSPSRTAIRRSGSARSAPDRGVLVGMRVGYVEIFGGPKVAMVQPIFQKGNTYIEGKPFGKPIPSGDDPGRQAGLRGGHDQHPHRPDGRCLPGRLHAVQGRHSTPRISTRRTGWATPGAAAPRPPRARASWSSASTARATAARSTRWESGRGVTRRPEHGESP